jgi:FixJ family two-component response regulator
MSGAGLLSKLRSQGNHTPAVLITGRLDEEAARTIQRGDAHFMTKPVDIPSLLSLLRSLLRDEPQQSVSPPLARLNG